MKIIIGLIIVYIIVFYMSVKNAQEIDDDHPENKY